MFKKIAQAYHDFKMKRMIAKLPPVTETKAPTFTPTNNGQGFGADMIGVPSLPFSDSRPFQF